MAKKRSRRSASPAQLAAQARFAAMYGGKKSKKRPNGKKRRAKIRRNDTAAETAAFQAEAKAGERAAKKAKKKAKKAKKKAAPKKAKKAAPKKAAPKKAKKAAKKAAPKKAKKAAPKKAKKAAPKKAKKAAKKAKRSSKKSKKLSAVMAALKKTRAELKKIPGKRPRKGQKIGKRSAKRRILKTKKAALNLTRSALIGSMSAAEKKMLQSAGLMRANPGFGEIFSSFAQVLPQAGVHVAALAGVAVASQKIGDAIAKNAPASMPGREFITKNAATVGSVIAAIGAYELVKHASPKTRPFAGAVLMGGLAAAFVHAAARSTWGAKIGLPVTAPAPAAPPAAALPAPAAALKGYIDVDGQALAVDGMGEYMALSGSTLTGSSLGEYMALSGSTLTGSSLGEIGQMSEGRQGARALNSPGDPTVEDVLDDGDEDEGSLSGSIFDD